MKGCTSGKNFIELLLLSIKLFKFKNQKCGQILCGHKPYFLMLGHICPMPTNPFNALWELFTHYALMLYICIHMYIHIFQARSKRI